MVRLLWLTDNRYSLFQDVAGLILSGPMTVHGCSVGVELGSGRPVPEVGYSSSGKVRTEQDVP